MFKKALMLCIVVFVFVGCTAKTPITNRSQMILISQQKELALGEQSYKDTLKKEKVIKDSKDARRVKAIGKRIANVVNKNYKWEFNLVDNKAKNAFCLPGGKVVVYTGILDVAKNDDQLATVISHEIAHALARHGAERMSSGMVASGLKAIGNILVKSQAPQYSKAFDKAYGVGAQYGRLTSIRKIARK